MRSMGSAFSGHICASGRWTTTRSSGPSQSQPQSSTADMVAVLPGNELVCAASFQLLPERARFSETTDKEIQEATRKRGFSSPTAFIRHSVVQELSGRSEQLVGAEERLVASIERVRQEVFRLGRAQQALFALPSRAGTLAAHPSVTGISLDGTSVRWLWRGPRGRRPPPARKHGPRGDRRVGWRLWFPSRYQIARQMK